MAGQMLHHQILQIPWSKPVPHGKMETDDLLSYSDRPRITINIIAPEHPMDQELLTLDLPPGLTLADFKGFITAETSIPQSSQKFYLNNRLLIGDHKTLEETGLSDGDMIALLMSDPNPQEPTGGSQQPQTAAQRNTPAAQIGQPDEIESTRQAILSTPASLAQVRTQRPHLAAAVNDPARFRQVWMDMLHEDRAREHERLEQMRLLNEDPMNVEAQRKIEEIIRQQSVQENLQFAYEHNPEGE